MSGTKVKTKKSSREGQSQKQLINMTVDCRSIPPSQKKDLLYLFLRDGEHAGEMVRVFPGILSLRKGDFHDQGFTEKHDSLCALRKCMEQERGGLRSTVLQVIRLVFAKGRGAREKVSEEMPGRFVSSIVDIVQNDPFPRVRVLSVLVLMRMGDPMALGTRLEDYLYGLLSEDVVTACSVLHFIMERFPSQSLRAVIRYLCGQDRPLPLMTVRVLEGFCETHLKKLDVKWALMHLRKHCSRQQGVGAEAQKKLMQDFLGSLGPWELARLSELEENGSAGRPGKGCKDDPEVGQKVGDGNRTRHMNESMKIRFGRIRYVGSNP
jgi:hypothetical protein